MELQNSLLRNINDDGDNNDKKQKKLKTWVGIFKNMGGNIPGGNFLGGNFLGGNFSGGSLMGGNFLGGNFPGGSFPGTVFNSKSNTVDGTEVFFWTLERCPP